MTFTIRSMTESDIDTVYAIEKNVHIAPWSRDILRDCVRVGYDCRVFEINVDENPIIVGYVICRISNNYSHILNLCIAKSFQSKGYGRKFLENILNSFIQLPHIEYVVLEVRPSNKIALSLYHSMGFEQVEIKPAYYTDNNKVEDAILLKKTLPF
ncbi:GCN5-related N-acetyltransferase [Legionella gratiana]|uniref:[Ribosomal protein bS18]-alanine N-acetyltransferase n=1 Tax=Legionella gratiana TaxID=45066 RepID=A0A378JAK6_9GAMM|nr:ribosomal protein S18-alanine N-acetyltransferase [Legionella gratiana]KTD15658.1 GCN5-related N-acetyltransferase [Legionella gratiana]STX44812.1 GCN5-related N-acetyltransferase [Legionella gratiana]